MVIIGNSEVLSWNLGFSWGSFDSYLEDHFLDDIHSMVKYGCTWLSYVLVSPPVGGGSSSKWGRIGILKLSVSH